MDREGNYLILDFFFFFLSLERFQEDISFLEWLKVYVTNLEVGEKFSRMNG